ncbi:MAG: glycosyltransferase [Geobacteraceae bacterium]|nr:glycosyltransferase [Geobacteraceae bacterium]
MTDSLAGNRRVVLHLILSLEIGGMEQVVVDLVKAIDRSRFVPKVLCLQSLGPLGEELRRAGIEVILLPSMMPLFSFIYPGGLVTAIRCAKADVVHVHSGCWFKGAVAARYAGVKSVVYTLHGATYAKAGVLKLLEQIAAWLTDYIVTVSGDLATQLGNAGHVPMDKVSVIINGIDTERFLIKPEKQVPPATPLQRGESAPIRLGIVARLEPVKSHETLLHAVRQLVDAGADILLEIIGDGSRRLQLETLTQSLGISDRVIFSGAVRDIPQRLVALDIFVLCSLSEGTSVSILEAMAAAKPVVATNVGGNPALITEDENGFLVPSDDPQALATAINRLVSDKALRLTMGEKNRIKVEEKFGKCSMARQYEGLY